MDLRPGMSVAIMCKTIVFYLNKCSLFWIHDLYAIFRVVSNGYTIRKAFLVCALKPFQKTDINGLSFLTSQESFDWWIFTFIEATRPLLIVGQHFFR